MVFFLRKVFLRWLLSHIPLPCGAALLPLPLGTGHETHIVSINLVIVIKICIHRLILPMMISYTPITIFRD
ncbi:unnamed protein product [Trifolium pratense]|uniref:Uncharacterized protein n=1 Tax=Trifolium pratense TaxID=57577 RepID=A0ACB0K0X9_TRIPR|nr:unnamed protein product [Trifolium pratense]